MPRVNLLQTRQMYCTCGAFNSDASMDNKTPAPSNFNVGITKDSGLTCCCRPNSSWTTNRYPPVHWRSPATHLLLPDAFRALQTTSLLAHFSIRRLVRHLLKPSPVLRPTCMHPILPEVTFGAESFEYMCQFMRGEVKFKGFLKGE